jgi:cholesterol oxidase
LSLARVWRALRLHIGFQFPDSQEDVVANSYNDVLNPLGLYEFDAFRDIAVIKGSGVGGTSLVNANVAIRPEPDIFSTWPSSLNWAAQIGEGKSGSLWNYYRLAEEMLDVSTIPRGAI